MGEDISPENNQPADTEVKTHKQKEKQENGAFSRRIYETYTMGRTKESRIYQDLLSVDITLT